MVEEQPSLSHGALWVLLQKGMPSRFEASQLFCHITGFETHDLIICREQPLRPEQVRRAVELIRRRQGGEPLQYLLGEWEFYGLPFLVGEGVLIPRGDTETLVDTARELVKETGLLEPRILDLCSGSGAVAVALAHVLPEAIVSAVELDETAFGYLERNTALNRVAVQAVRGDIFTYTPDRPQDVITANPPYIPSGELMELQEEVRHEPRTALDGGADGLNFYRLIARRYRRFLSPGGWLCLEVGMDQHTAVEALLLENGFAVGQVRRDLGGVPRVVPAKWKGEA